MRLDDERESSNVEDRRGVVEEVCQSVVKE
jgi:hypothetical protein